MISETYEPGALPIDQISLAKNFELVVTRWDGWKWRRDLLESRYNGILPFDKPLVEKPRGRAYVSRDRKIKVHSSKNKSEEKDRSKQLSLSRIDWSHRSWFVSSLILPFDSRKFQRKTWLVRTDGRSSRVMGSFCIQIPLWSLGHSLVVTWIKNRHWLPIQVNRSDMVETSRSQQVIVNLASLDERQALLLDCDRSNLLPSLFLFSLRAWHRTKTGSIPMLNFKLVEHRITFGVLTLGCTTTVSLVSAGSTAL